MDGYYKDNNPFDYAQKTGTRHVEFLVFLKEAENTYSVEWREIERNYDNQVLGEAHYKALISVIQIPHTSADQYRGKPVKSIWPVCDVIVVVKINVKGIFMKPQHIFKSKEADNPFMGILCPGLIIGSILLSLFIGTEYIAFNTGRPGLYQPFLGLAWSFEAVAKGIKDNVYQMGLKISAIVLVFSFIFVQVITFILRRKIKGTDIYGSAKWASEEDLKKSNLLNQDKGLYIGGWENKRKKTIEYLRDNTESHAIAVAPTGAGKGVGFVIPNLLSWEGSVIVFDLKGENYVLTSGYRKQELKQDILVFNPTNIDKIIVKEELELAGIGWTNFVEKMTNAGWAEVIDPARIRLNEDLSVIKNRLVEVFSTDIQKVLSVLQRPHGGTCACF